MNFSDIFKSSFLEKTTSFSVPDIIIGMLFAVIIGLFIFYIYKKTFSGVMYSAGFAMTLPGLAMVTTLVIMAVTSNVVLSLGMVGALSIVRFRTAIKEPMEIVYLFWSLAVGIIIGAGLIPMAVIGSLIIGVILLIFSNRKVNLNPYVVVVSCQNQNAERSAIDILNNNVEKMVIKTESVAKDRIELTAEIRLKDLDTSFIHELYKVDGINTATLVSFNGEYMS